jgi:DNA-binding NarL/FixJ family response regulator
MRLVIADDSILLREGLASLLAADGFDIVGQAGDAKGLLELVAKTVPDVALVDIRMPPSYSDEGIRAAGTIDRLHPGVGVLVLSQYIESAYAKPCSRRSVPSARAARSLIPQWSSSSWGATGNPTRWPTSPSANANSSD